MNYKFLLSFSLLGFVFSTQLGLAATHKHSANCEHFVTGESEIIPSGRDTDVVGEYEKAVQAIFAKGGLVDQLGLARPPHQIEFVPSGQLMVLATLGRHAVGHFHDGSILANKAYGSAGVLEFVTPGCPTCRSFYSDTTSLPHQISILFHVAGHNDVAAHSVYARSRNTDPIASSLELYELMESLYLNYDHDEVSQWYQYLLSVSMDQDIARGTFDDPKTFDPVINNGEPPKVEHLRAKNPEDNPPNPYRLEKSIKRPSPSLLQAIVTNLPIGAPKWKRDMAVLFEKIYRVYGFYSATKIMNEGWATLMMEVIAGHSPYANDFHNLEWADLLSGVAGRVSLSNPYWLGRECWRLVRDKFNKRGEIVGLTPLERDRRFIEYAHKEIIGHSNDYDFIRMALDENWVFKHKIHLGRPAKFDEIDRSLAAPKPGLEQKIIVSTNPKRIIDYIARQIADRRYQAPRIMIEDFSGLGRNVVSLRHDVVDNIPLKLPDAAQKLFVLSRILEKPVSLNTVEGIDGKQIRIEVEPSGRAFAYDSAGVLSVELSKNLQEAVNEYIDDYEMSVNSDLHSAEAAKYLPAITELQNSTIKASMALASHAPTAARAMIEYTNMLAKRFTRSLELAMSGKLKKRKTKGGVSFRVMPLIPKFKLDFAAIEALRERLPPSPVDFSTMATNEIRDGDVDIGSGPGRSGDKYWGPGKKQGQGDGDDEGDPADSDENEDPNHKQSPGKDPSEVEIPLEIWAKFLAEQIELPNLKPKGGSSEIIDSAKEGATQRPFGDMLYTRMAPKALALGKASYERRGIPIHGYARDALIEAGKTFLLESKKELSGFSEDDLVKFGYEALRSKGLPVDGVTNNILLREGFKFIQPGDYVVVDREHTPRPDMNAVIVILMDMSGSTQGWTLKQSKLFTYNLRALLKQKYKGLEFRYVAMDTRAFAFDDEKKFFKANLGGGNDYEVGFRKTEEILEEFPRERWDRYVFGIGDTQDCVSPADRAITSVRELLEQVEFMGYLHVEDGRWGDTLKNHGLYRAFEGLEKESPYFRMADITQKEGSDIEALKKIFKKTGE